MTIINDSNSLPSFKKDDQRIIKLYANIVDQGDLFEITIETPGVKKEDIEISINDNRLKVKVKKKLYVGEESEIFDFLLKERKEGIAERILSLPQNVDFSNLAASLENGILTIDLAKKTKRRIIIPID